MATPTASPTGSCTPSLAGPRCGRLSAVYFCSQLAYIRIHRRLTILQPCCNPVSMRVLPDAGADY